MELHSYAKRRIAKKWTTEQKRKLVETRITYDHWFINKPSNSVAPWKKVLAIAELDDFTVFFVRKQWSNMVAKYKQFKQNRLGDTNTKLIDNDMICRLTEEWEFFEPIHKYMVRKTANLHSYALTHKFEGDDKNDNDDDDDDDDEDNKNDKDRSEEDISNHDMDDTPTYGKRQQSVDDHMPSTSNGNSKLDFFKKDISNNIGMLVCGSNERIHELGDDMYDKKNYKRFVRKAYSPELHRNTDHDFYSKRICEDCETGKCKCENKKNRPDFGIYIAMPMKLYSTAPQNDPVLNMPIKQENATISYRQQPMPTIQANVNASSLQQIRERPPFTMQTNETNLNNQQAIGTTPSSSPRQPSQERSASVLSERDKYYRHKRYFYRQLGKRIDSVLHVCGQIIKVEYPNIDVSPLMDSSNLNINRPTYEGSTDNDSLDSNIDNIPN